MVHAVSNEQASSLPEGKALIGYLAPLRNPELTQILAKRRITSFSLDAIPRLSRAQSMDTLSSMATIAGYRAVTAPRIIGPFFAISKVSASTPRVARKEAQG